MSSQSLFFVLVILSSFSLYSTANGSFRVQSKIVNKKEIVLSAQPQKSSVVRKKILRQIPYYLDIQSAELQNVTFLEYEVSNSSITPSIQKIIDKQNLAPQSAPTLSSEVKTLIEQGPTQNRINLTILGDGYTLDEKTKFFADAERISNQLFQGSTFSSYLPLFNVFAVFVPSRESGLGDGSPKDTAFQLYRTPKGSKRAILPGDEAAIEKAIRLSPATDYPIVIANDEYYGGLGGRYAITTSSPRSGMIVLRHELGHNFGEVGEEYDNGGAYFGANNSRSPQVPWGIWSNGPVKIHEAHLLAGDYTWQNLSRGDYQSQFQIPHHHNLLFLSLSAVGWNTPQDVQVLLNQTPLALEGKFHDDRSFYLTPPEPVQPGTAYTIKISEKIHDQNNVLGFAVAFSAPSDYDFTPRQVAAFATYDQGGRKSYRPTHASCLMRDMELEHFCPIDQENMWHKFLRRVRLIDEVTVTKTEADQHHIQLKSQALSGLFIKWYRLGSAGAETEINELNQQTQWTSTEKGQFKVKVQFQTPEARRYNENFIDEQSFQIPLK